MINYYQRETFSKARDVFLKSFRTGFIQSCCFAFHECTLGLRDVTPADLTETEFELVTKLKSYMDTSNVSSETKKWHYKAESFSEIEQDEIIETIMSLLKIFQKKGE